MKPDRRLTQCSIRAGIVATLGAATLCACSLPAGDATDGSRSKAGGRSAIAADVGERITMSELDQMTDGFADRYLSYIVSAIDHIIKGNPSTEQIKRAHQVRVAQVSSVYDIVTNADPFTQLLDLILVVTLQSQKWIDEDQAEEWFGPRGQYLIDASRRAREDVWRMAARVMKPDQLEALDYMIWEWRVANRGVETVSFVRFDEFAAARGKSIVADVKSGGGLLAPVDDAKKAVDEVRLLAERAFYLGKRMPFLMNWHVESSVANVIDHPQIRAITDSVALTSKSVDRVTRVAEGLPAEISKQHQEIFAQLERTHPLVNAALVQYRGAVTDTDRLAGTVKDVGQSADVLLKTLRETTVSLDQAMKTIDQVFLQPGKDKPQPADAKPFDVESYAKTAVAFAGALREANELLGRTGAALGAGADAKWIEQRINDAAGLGTRIVDGVFWRGIVLITWFFLMLLLYRVVAARITGKSPA